MRVTQQQNRFLIQPKVNNLNGQSSLNEIIQAIKKNKYHFAEIIVDLNVFNPRYKNLLHQFFERIVQLKKDNVIIHVIWYIGDNEEVIEAGLNFQSAFDIRFDLQQKNEKKILLVDPDPFVREFMILSMMHKNIYIDYAENGKEAFDYLERFNYELVITELELDLFSGWELIHEIVKNSQQLPLIISEPHNIRAAQEMFKNYQMSYLEKPLKIEALLEYISQVLNRHDHERLAS